MPCTAPACRPSAVSVSSTFGPWPNRGQAVPTVAIRPPALPKRLDSSVSCQAYSRIVSARSSCSTRASSSSIHVAPPSWWSRLDERPTTAQLLPVTNAQSTATANRDRGGRGTRRRCRSGSAGHRSRPTAPDRHQRQHVAQVGDGFSAENVAAAIRHRSGRCCPMRVLHLLPNRPSAALSFAVACSRPDAPAPRLRFVGRSAARSAKHSPGA